MLQRMLRGAALAGAVLACLGPGWAAAQQGTYPERPIRFVVAYPPGGSTDTAARLIADALSRSMGQTVVVENRAGAGGTIGAAFVTKAAPDGYTLLFGSAAELSIAQATRNDVPFDALRDFAPVSLVGVQPFMLVANARLPVGNLGELLAWIRSNPGKVNYSSFGNNTTNHMTGEAFKVAAGIDATHVPYKGSAPSITDLIGGQVQFTFDTITATLPHVRSGSLRAIAVALPQRSTLVPDIPTLSESGLPGFTGGTWCGLLAPAGTPPAIVERLRREVVAALQSDGLRKEFASKGIEPRGTSPAEFAAFIESERARWTDLAARTGIKPR